MTEGQVEQQQTGTDGNQPQSLKRRALLGSIWTLASHGLGQVLRLVSNLILTRLLFPEAFGLMALVYTFLVGLEMFSDIGIRPSIIQSQRGADPVFLNTAWTVQVFRGLALWVGACVLAMPAAAFYKEPMLTQLLPAVGLTSLIMGLNSTKLATAGRQLDVRRLTILELAGQLIGLVVTILGAWIYQSVWALVIGGLVNSLFTMILSHVALEGEPNRLHWDRQAFKELHHFGRWIFLSTMLTFIAAQGDRLVLARLLDVKFLGVYTIALTLSRAIAEVINSIGDKVLFPSYAELVRDRPERLYPALRRSRLVLIALSWVGALFFIFLGEVLIKVLYDDRYADAGWMLQVLAIGTLVGCLGQTYNNVLLAKGRTFEISVLVAIQIVVQFAAIFLGAHLGGEKGLVIGLASIGWTLYPVAAICFARISLWQPEVDLPFIVAAAIVTAIFFFS